MRPTGVFLIQRQGKNTACLLLLKISLIALSKLWINCAIEINAAVVKLNLLSMWTTTEIIVHSKKELIDLPRVGKGT